MLLILLYNAKSVQWVHNTGNLCNLSVTCVFLTSVVWVDLKLLPDFESEDPA